MKTPDYEPGNCIGGERQRAVSAKTTKLSGRPSTNGIHCRYTLVETLSSCNSRPNTWQTLVVQTSMDNILK